MYLIMNKELILLKLESSLVILEEYYNMDMFELERENDILDGLGEPRDSEMQKILNSKLARITLVEHLISLIKQDKYFKIKESLKIFKEINKKLEAWDLETEYEIGNKIVKLMTKKIFN